MKRPEQEYKDGRNSSTTVAVCDARMPSRIGKVGTIITPLKEQYAKAISIFSTKK
ncbi:MAG: hypothetical protein JWQ96_1404 [Segetibacter sp.]|nr:hypothetical protein [Segetibacter sp.]